MIREMLKRLFCSHKNFNLIMPAELTLSDMDYGALGLIAFLCEDCGAKFFDKPVRGIK